MSRGVLATVLVVLGCVLAAPALTAFMLDREITDQGRYLEAITPLADDPVVRQAIATRITEVISAKLGPGDREAPESARRIVRSSVAKVVESEAFRPAWIAVNRAVHPRVVAMLRGETASLRIDDEAVLLDLGILMQDIKRRLAADGVPLADRLPDIDASIQLFSRPAIRRAMPAFNTLETLSFPLPIVVIALLATGLAIAPRRGRTLLTAGVGLSLAMLFLVVYQWIARNQLAASSRSPELARAFYDALTHQIKVLLWLVFGIAVALVVTVLVQSRVRKP